MLGGFRHLYNPAGSRSSQPTDESCYQCVERSTDESHFAYVKKLIHCEILNAHPCIHYNSPCVPQSAAHQGSGREGNSHEMPGEGGEEEKRKAKFMGSRERRGERLRTAKWERKDQ